MKDFYLFDAGSTKTIFISSDNGEIQQVNLPGVNPNRDVNAFKTELLEVFNPESNIPLFFYGSGLGSDKNKEVIKEIFSSWSLASIEIHDDITGAARALYGNNSGILGIMGTGGLSAYYDGERIVARRGGYGYLIDDLGGGYELGKEIISAWLNNDLPNDVDQTIDEYLRVEKSEFTTEYYADADLSLVAGLVSRIDEHVELPEVRRILYSYFERFINRNVIPLAAEYKTSEVNLIGSIANAFENTIQEIFISKGLKCEQIVKYPIDGLIKYHTSKS